MKEGDYSTSINKKEFPAVRTLLKGKLKKLEIDPGDELKAGEDCSYCCYPFISNIAFVYSWSW
jgi:hypothetical protein